MDSQIIDPGIRHVDIVKALLELSNIQEPPTDEYAIAAYLEVTIEPFSDPKHLGLGKNVRAYVIPGRRLIGVHASMPHKRKKYSILHEIGHLVLPGHAMHPELLADERITDDLRNFGLQENIVQLEKEANQFAADCLFQLDRFDRIIQQVELTWDNIRSIANKFEASFEATARRWVERSLEACALVAFNPVSRNNAGANLEVMYTITSESFRDLYFAGLSGYEVGSDSLLYRIFYGLEYTDNPVDYWYFDLPHGSYEFQVSLFSNSYRMFGILTPTENIPF